MLGRELHRRDARVMLALALGRLLRGTLLGARGRRWSDRLDD